MMAGDLSRSESFDFAGAFSQGWVQYRANFIYHIPFAVLAALPPFAFYYSVEAGIVTAVMFQNMFILMLADVLQRTATSDTPAIGEMLKKRTVLYFKNGFVVSIFVFPLLVLGALPMLPFLISTVVFPLLVILAALILPAVFFFSIFMYSFFEVAVKSKFGIDACMESFRLGKGYRLYGFILAILFFLVYALLYVFLEPWPIAIGVGSALFLPYFFSVIREIFEQLEKK